MAPLLNLALFAGVVLSRSTRVGPAKHAHPVHFLRSSRVLVSNESFVQAGASDDNSSLAAGGPEAVQAVHNGTEQLQQKKEDMTPPSSSTRSKPHHFDSHDVVHGKGLEVPTMAYPLTALLLAVVVVSIFGSRGPQVVLGVLAYLASLSTMTLSVKWVFATHGFRYAKFISVLHFLAGALVTFIVLLRQTQKQQIPFPIPGPKQFWCLIFPISLAVVASIGANNMALVLCSVAFTEIIGSTNCLVTIAMVILMGMRFDKWLILPTMLVAVGATFSITGEVNFSAAGMLLAFTANVFRSMKASLQQKLMTGDPEERLDPCALLFWVSVPSVVVMFLASLCTEGFAPYVTLATMESGKFRGLMSAILVSCANATVLNLAQLFVTKDLGAVGSQLAAQAKSVLTVLGSMVLFGDPVTLLEIVGFAQVLAGVYLFSRMDQRGKEGSRPSPLLEGPAKPPQMLPRVRSFTR